LAEVRRVLFVADSYAPRVGGAERLLQTFLARLRASDVDAWIAVPAGAVQRRRAGDEVILAPARATPLGWWVSPSWWRREIDRVRPQIIQTSGPSFVEWSLLAAEMAARSRRPRISLYHCHLDLTRPVSRVATRMHTRLVLPRFDAVVTTAPAVVDDVRGWGIGAELILPGLLEAVPRSFPSTRGREILFVGRLPARHTQKRPDLLIEAFGMLRKEVPDATLHFVGGGPGVHTLALLARRLGVERHIIFHGELRGEALEARYRDAACLVLPSPSRSEGFSLVLIEALARGCPVVLSRGVGSAPFLEPLECATLFEPNDRRSLAEAIGSVLLRDERIAEGSFRLVCEQLLARRMVDQFLALWSSRLDGSMARR